LEGLFGLFLFCPRGPAGHGQSASSFTKTVLTYNKAMANVLDVVDAEVHVKWRELRTKSTEQ
jgi:hypothetical protein